MMLGKYKSEIKGLCVLIAVAILLGGLLFCCKYTYHQYPWDPYWSHRVNYMDVQEQSDDCREIAIENLGFLEEFGDTTLLNSVDKELFISDALQSIGLNGTVAEKKDDIVLFYFQYQPEYDIGICYSLNALNTKEMIGKPLYTSSPVRNIYMIEPINDNVYCYICVAEFH